MPRIEDFSNQYTLEELESLSDFVEQELRLSSPIELAWLDVIEIRDLGLNTNGDWYGRYDGQTFKASITHTFVSGNLAYQNGKFVTHQIGKRLSFTR